MLCAVLWCCVLLSTAVLMQTAMKMIYWAGLVYDYKQVFLLCTSHMGLLAWSGTVSAPPSCIGMFMCLMHMQLTQ